MNGKRVYKLPHPVFPTGYSPVVFLTAFTIANTVDDDWGQFFSYQYDWPAWVMVFAVLWRIRWGVIGFAAMPALRIFHCDPCRGFANYLRKRAGGVQNFRLWLHNPASKVGGLFVMNAAGALLGYYPAYLMISSPGKVKGLETFNAVLATVFIV